MEDLIDLGTSEPTPKPAPVAENSADVNLIDFPSSPPSNVVNQFSNDIDSLFGQPTGQVAEALDSSDGDEGDFEEEKEFEEESLPKQMVKVRSYEEGHSNEEEVGAKSVSVNNY